MFGKSAEEVPTSKKVLIVGAGPAGLAAAAALKALQVPFDVIESEAEVGGAYRAPEFWSELETVSSKHQNGFEDMIMPASYPMFPTLGQMATYFRAYVAKHDLAEHIQFNTALRSATPYGDEQWQTEFSNGQVATYRALICATGARGRVNLPDWAQDEHQRLREFPGVELLHADDFRGETYAGKKVLVVGAGQSAADIATYLSRTAAKTYLSMRTSHWIVPRFIGPVPGDIAAAKRPAFLGHLNGKIGNAVVSKLYGDNHVAGLPQPKYSVLNDRVIVSDHLLEHISSGRIDVVNDVESFNSEHAQVQLRGGGFLEVDAIILATGHQLEHSFLKQRDGSAISYEPAGLAWGAFPRDRSDLVLLGQAEVAGGNIPVLSAQADVAAYALAAQFKSRPAAQLFNQMKHDASMGVSAYPEHIARAGDQRRLPRYDRNELLSSLAKVRQIFES